MALFSLGLSAPGGPQGVSPWRPGLCISPDVERAAGAAQVGTVVDKVKASIMAESRWSPDSWRSKRIEQAPVYADARALAEVEKQLAGFPPLVFAGEVRKLKRALAKAAAARPFCSRAGIALRASPSTRLTISAIASGSS